jgi:hypothetical protein
VRPEPGGCRDDRSSRESATEPAVAYVDEDRVPRLIARSFSEFESGLVGTRRALRSKPPLARSTLTIPEILEALGL